MEAKELVNCVEPPVAFRFNHNFDMIGVNKLDREFSNHGGAVVAAVEADWTAGGEAKWVRKIVRGLMGRT